jgi:hypothetical protein
MEACGTRVRVVLHIQRARKRKDVKGSRFRF